MKRRLVRGIALAIVGVLLFVSPLVFLGLSLFFPELTTSSSALVPFLVGWIVVDFVGYAALTAGVRILDRARTSPVGLPRPRRSLELRLVVVAGMLMLLGFLVVVATLVVVAGCQPACTGGGGVVSNGANYGATMSCGMPCALYAGSAEIWPLQLMAVGLGASMLGSSFAVIAVARAFVVTAR